MAAPALHVIRDESEYGWWEMVSRAPAESLRGLVRRYTGYRENSTVALRRREVPTGDVSLILSFGPRIRVVDQHDPAIVRHRLTSFIAPVDDTWALTEYTGEQYGVDIKMTPLGASRVLGVPMDSLLDQVVDLEGVLGAEGRLVVERLADAPSWPRRFDVLDTVLSALVARGRAPSPAAAWAWRRLNDTDGRIPIGRLVDELGCSHRYLLSEFRTYVGVAPKTLARVLRCQRAIRLLDNGKSGRLADLALACGYSDQAHLNRDFRLLTGLSPTLWNDEPRLDLPEL
jgi:AraC-like DNA-binding protein